MAVLVPGAACLVSDREHQLGPVDVKAKKAMPDTVTTARFSNTNPQLPYGCQIIHLQWVQQELLDCPVLATKQPKHEKVLGTLARSTGAAWACRVAARRHTTCGADAIVFTRVRPQQCLLTRLMAKFGHENGIQSSQTSLHPAAHVAAPTSICGGTAPPASRCSTPGPPPSPGRPRRSGCPARARGTARRWACRGARAPSPACTAAAGRGRLHEGQDSMGQGLRL